VLAIRELAQQYGLLDKVTITSSSREVLGAALELVPDVKRGLVAEYAWLDPLKVAQNYGCNLLALNWTLCTPERLLNTFGVRAHYLIDPFDGAHILRLRAP